MALSDTNRRAPVPTVNAPRCRRTRCAALARAPHRDASRSPSHRRAVAPHRADARREEGGVPQVPRQERRRRCPDQGCVGGDSEATPPPIRARPPHRPHPQYLWACTRSPSGLPMPSSTCASTWAHPWASMSTPYALRTSACVPRTQSSARCCVANDRGGAYAVPSHTFYAHTSHRGAALMWSWSTFDTLCHFPRVFSVLAWRSPCAG